MRPIITLTTDFGTTDGYVGAIKGVILSICPQVRLVDITHAVPPQNVVHAAFTLLNATPYFPNDTVHLVVVDPGVGTARRPLAISTGSMRYVGPDNGVFSLVARPTDRAVALENPAYHRPGSSVSHTFHGRDIFAPGAAHLAAGAPLDEFGPRVVDWVTLSFPKLDQRSPHQWNGEVLFLDHFGNAVTNIGLLVWKEGALRLTPFFGPDDRSHLLPATPMVIWRERTLAMHHTYGKVAPGTPIALVGSNGFLEIAVRDGSAADSLGIRVGDQVALIAGGD